MCRSACCESGVRACTRWPRWGDLEVSHKPAALVVFVVGVWKRCMKAIKGLCVSLTLATFSLKCYVASLHSRDCLPFFFLKTHKSHCGEKKKKEKVPLIPSVLNPMTQLRWHLLCLRERSSVEEERHQYGHQTQLQYLHPAGRLSGWPQMSYYADINECTLRKVNWPTHWCTRARVRAD